MTIINAFIKKKTRWRRRAGKAPLPVAGPGRVPCEVLGLAGGTATWGGSQRAAICEARRGWSRPLPHGLLTKPPRRHLALRLAASRMGKKQRPMVKAPYLWCFIMAAWANWYKTVEWRRRGFSGGRGWEWGNSATCQEMCQALWRWVVKWSLQRNRPSLGIPRNPRWTLLGKVVISCRWEPAGVKRVQPDDASIAKMMLVPQGVMWVWPGQSRCSWDEVGIRRSILM